VTLEADILFSIVANETDAGDYAKDVRTTKVDYFKELSDGTGANQAQIVWSDSRIAPANDEDSINLLAATDDRGTCSFTSVKAIYVKNTGASEILWTGGEWQSGPLPQNGASLKIRPGGAMFLAAPDAQGWLTPGGSSFRIDNETATNGSYDIVLIGEGTIT